MVEPRRDDSGAGPGGAEPEDAGADDVAASAVILGPGGAAPEDAGADDVAASAVILAALLR